MWRDYKIWSFYKAVYTISANKISIWSESIHILEEYRVHPRQAANLTQEKNRDTTLDNSHMIQHNMPPKENTQNHRKNTEAPGVLNPEPLLLWAGNTASLIAEYWIILGSQIYE